MPDDVVIKITGDDSSAQAALGRTKTSIKQLGEQARTVGFGMAAIGAAVGVVAVSGVKAAVNFESAMAGVAKTVDGTTAEIAAMGAELQRLSTEIPITTNELAGIAETAGQLGIAKEGIVDFTEVMAGLGVATNLTAEEAATSMARIANVTGLAQDKFDEMGSALVALGNNLATTEGEILTFTQRIAGAGKIAGLTEPQILAIGGAMTSVGVQAEAGGTAVQKVLLGMTEAVADSTDDLRTFARVAGVSAADFAMAFEQDAGRAFTSFVEGLGRAGTDAFGILEELGLQDQRLIRSFLSLAGAGDLLSDSISLSTQAFKDNTALTVETEKRYETAAAQMQIFKNEVTLLAVNIGNALLPVMQDMVDILKPVVQGIGTFIEQHPTLTKLAVASGLAIGALGTALVAVGVVIPAIQSGVALLSGAMLALKVSSLGATAALGPWGLAIAGAAAFAGTLYLKMKDSNREAASFADTLNTKVTPAFDPTLAGAADAAVESLEHLPPALQASIEKARGLTQVANDLNAALMGTEVSRDAGGMGRPVEEVADAAAEAFLKLRNSVAEIPVEFTALGRALRESTRTTLADFATLISKADDLRESLQGGFFQAIDRPTGIIERGTFAGIPLVETRNLIFDLTTETGRLALATRDLQEAAAARAGGGVSDYTDKLKAMTFGIGEATAAQDGFTASLDRTLESIIAQNQRMLGPSVVTTGAVAPAIPSAGGLLRVAQGQFLAGEITQEQLAFLQANLTQEALTPQPTAAQQAAINISIDGQELAQKQTSDLQGKLA